MKYFSMFSGIGGFELGIQQATKNKWECIGFSEIDKHAIHTYKKHFPKHKNWGSATKIKPEQLPDFDLLCGGFPCQAFSIAGKRMGFEDTRGTLFFDIARIIKVKRPRFVFLENVKGLLSHNNGRTFAVILATLSELGYNAEWEVLNSKHFGVPQNRERVFIVGHLRGTSSPQIFPIGQGSEEVDESREFQEQVASTLTTADAKIGRGINMIADFRNDEGLRVRQDEISPCLSTRKHSFSDPSTMPPLIIPVLTPDRPEKRQNGRRFKENGDPSFTLTGQDIHGVMLGDGCDNRSCLRSGRTPEVGFEGHSIRRLTPVECERLQGFPDDWTKGVSDTQRYKQCGNAVTVNVIKEIVERLKNEAVS